MSWVAAAVGGSAVLGYLGSGKAADAQQAGAKNASKVQWDMYNQTRDDLAPYRDAGPVALSELMNRLGLNSGPKGSAPTREQFTTQKTVPLGGMMDRNYMGQLRGPGGYITQQFPNQQQGGSEFDQAGFDKATADYNAQGSPDANTGQLLKPFGMDDFQQSPAYQFNLQEGEKAINKASNARGNLYAPQTMQDLGKYSQGLASNEFQNAYSNYNNNLNNIWNRLYGLTGTGQNAAAQTGGFGAGAANQIGQNITGGANAQAAGIVGQTNAITGGIGDAYNQYLLNSVLNGQKGNYGVNAGAGGGPIFGGS